MRLLILLALFVVASAATKEKKFASNHAPGLTDDHNNHVMPNWRALLSSKRVFGGGKGDGHFIRPHGLVNWAQLLSKRGFGEASQSSGFYMPDGSFFNWKQLAQKRGFSSHSQEKPNSFNKANNYMIDWRNYAKRPFANEGIFLGGNGGKFINWSELKSSKKRFSNQAAAPSLADAADSSNRFMDWSHAKVDKKSN